MTTITKVLGTDSLGNTKYAGSGDSIELLASGSFGSSIDWSGGNVTYVPLSGDIQTYISNAASGDTLVLAAGLYTITAGLTIPKKLHLRGQGEGQTYIYLNSNIVADSMIHITTEDNSRISDMTIQVGTSGVAGSMLFLEAGAYLANLELINGTTVGGGEFDGVFCYANKTFEIENCTYSTTNSRLIHIAFGDWWAGGTMNLRNCKVNSSGATHAGYGNTTVYGATGSTVNCYNSSFFDSTDQASGCIRTEAGIVNLYNCVVSGSGATAYDVKNVGGTFTIYDTCLVNNTTSGTITRAGTVNSKRLQLYDTWSTPLVMLDAAGASGPFGLGIDAGGTYFGLGIWVHGVQKANFENGGLELGTYTGYDCPTNGLIVAGDVGIGTYSPTTKLQVAGHTTPSASGIYNTGSQTLPYASGYFSSVNIVPSTALHSADGIKTKLIANGTFSFGDVGYIDSAGTVTMADASVIATSSAIAMCAEDTIASDSGDWLLNGIARDTSWSWTPGSLIYLSITGTTGNTLSAAAPTSSNEVVQVLGVALTTDKIFFNPQLVQVEVV